MRPGSSPLPSSTTPRPPDGETASVGMKNASDMGPPGLYPHLSDRKVGYYSDVSLESVPRPVAVSGLVVPVPKGLLHGMTVFC